MNMVRSGIKMLILDNMAVNMLQENHSPNKIMMAYCNHIISFLYFISLILEYFSYGQVG